MSVCLLIIDDGRGYVDGCLESAAQYLPPMDACVMIDDSDHELGFAGAVQAGWEGVLETGCEFVFHLESDFRFTEPVGIERMVNLLRRYPHLTQVSLLRQPWNDEEKAAGGIIQAYPEQFDERVEHLTLPLENGGVRYQRDVWTETDRFIFTTNPSVYSVELCRRGFPDPPEAEGRFGGAIRAERPEARCGIWGGKFDGPRVQHIGEHRAGRGY